MSSDDLGRYFEEENYRKIICTIYWFCRYFEKTLGVFAVPQALVAYFVGNTENISIILLQKLKRAEIVEDVKRLRFKSRYLPVISLSKEVLDLCKKYCEDNLESKIDEFIKNVESGKLLPRYHFLHIIYKRFLSEIERKKHTFIIYGSHHLMWGLRNKIKTFI